MNKPRILVAALSLSAAGFLSIVDEEGYTDRAARPTPLDVPTVGFGSTVKEDGTPVRMGDAVTPPRAVRLAVRHIEGTEAQIRACAGDVQLSQAEYDLYVNFAYNVGPRAFCGSTMLARLKAGDRVGACEQFTRWRFHAGFDCATPGNRVCPGLWQRRLAAKARCLEEAAR